MREVYLKDQKLGKILWSMTDKVFGKDLTAFLSKAHNRPCDLIKGLPPTDERYLRKALQLNSRNFGYPRSAHGLSTTDLDKKESQFFHNAVVHNLERLKTYLGAPVNALCMLYPENGYIEWHHNGNAPGYNILLSYSIDGNGCFKYYDRDTDTIVIIQDRPGWNIKVGYYPDERREQNRIYWHSAITNSPRLSVAFIINNRKMWSNMIDTITMGDYDKNFIEHQGPLRDVA